MGIKGHRHGRRVVRRQMASRVLVVDGIAHQSIVGPGVSGRGTVLVNVKVFDVAEISSTRHGAGTIALHTTV